MAALVVVVLLVGVGAIVLLSGGGDDDVELTEAQLTDALVTEGDVGDGYVIDPEGAEDDGDEFDLDEIDASEECLDLYEELEASGSDLAGGEADVQAKVELDGTAGEQIEETLSQGTEATLGMIRELVDVCDEIAVDDGESVGSITFEIVDDVVEVGDDSLTLRLEVDLDEPFDLTAASVGVLWERDGTYASVNITGPVDEETFDVEDPDLGLLADVVTIADDKLAEVISEA
jgi:hypothetical protein